MFKSLLLWVILLVSQAQAVVVEKIAAVVNNDVITWGEIYDLGGEHIEEQVNIRGEEKRTSLEIEVLDALIGRRLIEQEIQQLSLDVTEAELERALSNIARQNNIERSRLQAEIEAAGLSWENYLEELKGSLRDMKFNQAVLGSRISVREDEILAAYRTFKTQYQGPTIASLQTILLPVSEEALAHDLKKRIESGEDFGDLAAQNSQEPYGSQRGEMGSFKEGELMQEINDPVFASAKNGIVGPIVTRGGIFLIKVVDVQKGGVPELEEVREQITQEITASRYEEAREQWLIQARKRSAVSILIGE